MKEFIELREAELKAELEKANQQINELKAVIHRIEGAFVILAELKAKLEDKP